METPKEYYYTYYSYEEWGMGYFGSRGCNCLPEEDVKYFGSFSDKNFNPTQKIILKDDYNTREEAYADEIILHDYYDVANNPHFANRAKATSTKFYVSYEIASKNGKEYGKIVGKKCWENKTGMFRLTKEQRREIGLKNYKNGKGLFSLTKEQKSEIGKKTFTEKKGVHSLSKEETIKNATKGGKKAKELGLGIHAQTKEERSKICTRNNYQKWMCLETGFVTNAGTLSRYQKARGIDTSKRIRIE
jgi:hypothetical protein